MSAYFDLEEALEKARNEPSTTERAQKKAEAYYQAYVLGRTLPQLEEDSDLNVEELSALIVQARRSLTWEQTREEGLGWTWCAEVGYEMRLLACFDWMDREVAADLHVLYGRGGWSTQNTMDWPVMERAIPRSMWPHGAYIGKKGRRADQRNSVWTPMVERVLLSLWDDEGYWDAGDDDPESLANAADERAAMRRDAALFGIKLP